MNLRKKPVYLYEEPAKKTPKPKRTAKQPEPAAQPPAPTVAQAYEPVEYVEVPDSTPTIEDEPTPAKKKKEKKPKKDKMPKVKKEKPPKLPGQSRISKKGVLGIVSIGVALLVAFVASPLVTRMANEETAVIVRTKAAISKGAQLDASQFQLVTVPARGLPRNAVATISDITGKYAAVDIPAEDTMLISKISDSIPFPDSYLYQLPEGKQAMSIRIKNFESGLSGKLLKDDVVSVYASWEDDKESYLAIAPPELRYVPVLSVTTETGADYDKQDSSPESKSEDLPITVEMLVSDRQAAALAGLNQNGSIHLSLVSRGNPDYMVQLLEAQEEILAELAKETDTPEEEEAIAEEVLEVETIE